MKNYQKLNRSEMKNVLGGSADVAAQCYECCPDGDASSTQCSSKVTVKPGFSASCSQGKVTKVTC